MLATIPAEELAFPNATWEGPMSLGRPTGGGWRSNEIGRCGVKMQGEAGKREGGPCVEMLLGVGWRGRRCGAIRVGQGAWLG